MSEALIEAYASAWTPEDDRPAVDWAIENVKPPQSARSSSFDIEATPWLREPINQIPDNRNKLIVCIMPTGAGKTTIMDVDIARSLAVDPGSILATLQNDEEADGYWEERLMPILEKIPSVDQMLSSLPRGKRKKGFISFPHMSLYCSSAKWKALQRKSVRKVWMDEAWMVQHGFIEEAKNRTHNRWNQRIGLLSQGGTRFIDLKGEFVPTELESAWESTNQSDYCMVCPDCGEAHPWKWSSLLFESAETSDGQIDERAVIESARYKCPGRCGIEFEDKINIRRKLSLDGVYAAQNERAIQGHIGFHVHGLALYYVAWGERALKWRKAQVAKQRGDLKPLCVIIQKDFAEFWDEHEHRYSSLSDEAPKSDYVIVEDDQRFPGVKCGIPWEDEYARFMCADRQALDGGYFVATAAAFSRAGTSRVIWAGRLDDESAMRDKQLELGIPDKCVGIDCADDTSTINAVCSKFGWMEFLGSDRENWPHYDRKKGQTFYLPWSLPERVGGLGQNAPFRILWSNDYYHELHTRRLGHHGNLYGVPSDIEDFAVYKDPATGKPTGFWEQMRAMQRISKVNKATGKQEMKYVRIGKRPDHYKDARCMLLVRASFEAFRKGYGWQLGEEDHNEKNNTK